MEAADIGSVEVDGLGNLAKSSISSKLYSLDS